MTVDTIGGLCVTADDLNQEFEGKNYCQTCYTDADVQLFLTENG